MTDKRSKEYSLGRGLADVYERGVTTGLEAELSAEIARNWTLPSGGQRGHWQNLYVPWSAFSRRDMAATVPTLGSEWIGRKDLLVQPDLLIAPSVCVQAGAITVTGLRGDTVVPQVTTLPTPLFIPENAPAPRMDLTTGQAGPLTPHRMSSETIVSNQLILQGGQLFETLIRNDLARAFSMEFDAMTLFGRGVGNNEPTGILNVAGALNVPITPATMYEGLLIAKELVGLEGVELESFAYITGPSVARLMATTPKNAASGDADVFHSLDPVFVSPRVNVDRVFFGSFSNVILAFFGPGFRLSVNPFTYANEGRTSIVCDLYGDIVIRWPRSVGFTSVLAPFAERNGGKKVKNEGTKV